MSSSSAERLGRGGVTLAEARPPEGMRIYAIGDIHGCFDQLRRMQDLIADELAADRPADWRIIHLGDYIDRGPQSRQVVEHLAKATAEDSRMIALMGNHDFGLLEFLESDENDRLFARFGGETTAESYGVRADFTSPETRGETRARLAQAVPAAHRVFLEALPRSVSFGDFHFCHAGIRPGIPLERQDPVDLIWIRRDFLDHPGPHPKVVVHGHTPVERAELHPARVNVDTGCYQSGLLTAFVVDETCVRIREVSGRASR